MFLMNLGIPKLYFFKIWWFVYTNLMDYSVHCYRSWLILFKILNSLMCALANFHLKVRLLWNFHRIYQNVQIYYLCPFPFHIFLFSFFFFCMNDFNLCSKLHCIVIDYKYFLHGLPVDSDYHNWVLSKFSYKHSLSFCIMICMFVFFCFNNNFGLVNKKV